MNKVEKIKQLVKEFNIEKEQITKQIVHIEAQRRILAQLRNNKKAIGDNSAECQEQINRLAQKIADLGNKSQTFQTEINTKNILLKEQICELLALLMADGLIELKRSVNKTEYEKDVYQQIEKYCDTDQQIAQIEEIMNAEKHVVEIKEKQQELNDLVKKVKNNQISLVVNALDEMYTNKIVFEEINMADFIPVEETEIITLEDSVEQVFEENIAREISNVVIKFEKGDLVYKATLNDGEEINFFPSIAKQVKRKDFISNIKKALINYVIKAHKILDNSVIKHIDPNICLLFEKVAEKCELNYMELVYNYAMSFSNEEEVKTSNAPIILYNLYYINESKLTARERSKLIKISKLAQKNADFDVMGYNIALLRIQYFFKRILGYNNLKEISGEKIQ